MEKTFILLTGHRKCGTTMFLNLFDNHPEICCYPWDIHILYAYFPNFLKNNQKEDILRKRLNTIICENMKEKVKKFNLDQLDVEKFNNDFMAGLNASHLRSPGHVISALTEAWSLLVSEENRSFMVIKESSADIYASELYDWFPKLRIIQLIRDPRDNYASLKSGVSSYYSKLGENEKETLASLLNRALLDMKMALINENRFGSNRYMVVRFEDVVSGTESCMRKVSSFIGVEFNQLMLKPTVCGYPTLGNSFEKEQMFAVTNKNVGRWHKRISDEEAKIIEFYFNGIMEKFGYQPEYSTEQQAEAATEFYKWLNYRYFYSDRFTIGVSK